MITGAVAGIISDETRLTNGIDLVIDLEADGVGRFVDIFPIEGDILWSPFVVLKKNLSRKPDGMSP